MQTKDNPLKRRQQDFPGRFWQSTSGSLASPLSFLLEMAGAHKQEFFSDISLLRAENSASVALLALVAYEHLITLHREVQVIWYQRFSIYSILLFINRYCILAWTIAVLASTTTILRCNITTGFVVGLEVALRLNGAVFAAARAYSISTWRYRAGVALFILGLDSVAVVVDLYQLSGIFSSVNTVLDECTSRTAISSSVNLQLSSVTAVCNIAGDLCLLVVIWMNATQSWTLTIRGGYGASISQLMMRDGTMYFVALLVINISDAILSKTTGVFIVAPLGIVLISVLSSRFILNLRWQDHKTHRLSDVSLNSFYFSQTSDELCHPSNSDIEAQDRRSTHASEPVERDRCTFITSAAPDDQPPDDGQIEKLHHKPDIV